MKSGESRTLSPDEDEGHGDTRLGDAERRQFFIGRLDRPPGSAAGRLMHQKIGRQKVSFEPTATLTA